LDFTIKKLSGKRKADTVFYPEQRLDVFLARLLNKTIDNIHTDILQKTVLVNNKLVISYDLVLSNKDFIYI
jgi:RNA-binding protein YlmH